MEAAVTQNQAPATQLAHCHRVDCENVSVPGTLQNDESRPLGAALGMWA